MQRSVISCWPVSQAARLLITAFPDAGEPRLADRVVASFCPDAKDRATNLIFSIDFFSTAGRNIGTYILPMESLQVQHGEDGMGRVWTAPLGDLQAEMSLRSAIRRGA